MSFRGGSAKAGDRFFDTSVARPPVFLCRNPGAIRSPDSGDGVHLMCLVSICFIQGGRNLGLVSCPESGLQNAPGSRHRKIKKSVLCVRPFWNSGATRLIGSLPQHSPNFGLSMLRWVQCATSTTNCGSGRTARDQWVEVCKALISQGDHVRHSTLRNLAARKRSHFPGSKPGPLFV